MSTKVKVEHDAGTARIIMHTESGVNVMSSALLRDLRGVVSSLARDNGTRAVVFTAEGKVFAAGADIKEMSGFTGDQARAYGELGQSVLNEVAALPLLTVAAINGAALGGGLELSMACDFRIAVKSARIGLPETNLGLIPGWSGIKRLTTLVGPARAKRLYYAGLPISAEDGVPIGLIDEIVNSVEDLGPRVDAFCRSFRRGSPAAVKLAKQAWLTGDDLSAFAACFENGDAREGIAAFVEKRTASWME